MPDSLESGSRGCGLLSRESGSKLKPDYLRAIVPYLPTVLAKVPSLQEGTYLLQKSDGTPPIGVIVGQKPSLDKNGRREITRVRNTLAYQVEVMNEWEKALEAATELNEPGIFVDGEPVTQDKLDRLQKHAATYGERLLEGLGVEVFVPTLKKESRLDGSLSTASTSPSTDLPERLFVLPKQAERKSIPFRRKVPHLVSTGIVAAGVFLGARGETKPILAASASEPVGITTAKAVPELEAADSSEVTITPVSELAVVPLEEVLAAPEAQGDQKLTVLTGAELTEQVDAYYEGTDTPQDLIEKAYSQTQAAYVKLGLPSTREMNPLFPDIVFTVGEKTSYNPTTGELQSGTERAYYWNGSFAFFAKDENGSLSLKKLPDVWKGEDKLIPYVSGSGSEAEIALFDGYARKVATFGTIAHFSLESNPIKLLRVLSGNGEVVVLKIQIAGSGGKLEGGGEVNSEVVEANGSQPVESEDYQNFTLSINEQQSLEISLLKTSIPPGGASFTYNNEKERFEVKSVADATNYGIVDKGGNFWFIGAPKSSSINIRQSPSTSSEIVGQYTSGQEILIVGKVQEGAYYWYKTSSGGYVRDDVANVYNLYLIPDYDDPPEPPGEKLTLLPLVEASAGRDMKNINIGVPSEALLNRLGITLDEVSAANFVIEGYSDTGEANKVRVYEAQNSPLMVAEYNSVSQRWEWKESVLEGIPYPESEQINDSLKIYTRDLGFDQAEVTNRLKYEPRTDFRGETYPLLVDTQTGYPILVWIQNSSGEWEWVAPSINALSAKKGLEFGLAVSKADQNWSSREYQNALHENASIVVPVGHSQLTIDEWGPRVDSDFMVDAIAHGQAVRVTMFWNHADVGKELQAIYDQYKNTGELQTKVSEFMDNRIDQVLSMIERAAGIAGKPVEDVNMEIIFANEAFWEYQGTVGWEESPYLQAYQNKNAGYPAWLVEAYLKTLNGLKAKGFNEDKAKLVYNDYAIERGGTKSKEVLRQLKLVKVEIAKRLNIPVEQVIMYVGMQSHFNLPGMEEGDKINSSIIESPIFTQNMRNFAQAIGPVMHTEIYQTVGTISQKSANVVALTKACEEVGPQVCEGVTFYGMMRVENQDWQILFDQEFKNTTAYWELLKTLSSDSVVRN